MIFLPSDSVCNSCGAFDNISACSFCPTLVCGRCKARHEFVCEDNQKRKKRGEGPTVRNSGKMFVVPPPASVEETPGTPVFPQGFMAAVFPEQEAIAREILEVEPAELVEGVDDYE